MTQATTPTPRHGKKSLPQLGAFNYNQARSTLDEMAPLTEEQAPTQPAPIDEPAPLEQTLPATTAKPKAKKTAARVAAPQPAKRDRSGQRTPQGESPVTIYIPRDLLDPAKSAFIVDFDHGGPTSFGRWLDAAIRAHLARSHKARAKIGAAMPSFEGEGDPRRFVVTDATIEAMRVGIIEERRVGARVLSRSEFMREAIYAAIQAAREKTGGVLPPAPARLPSGPLAR